jgi:hypothetical protein
VSQIGRSQIDARAETFLSQHLQQLRNVSGGLKKKREREREKEKERERERENMLPESTFI